MLVERESSSLPVRRAEDLVERGAIVGSRRLLRLEETENLRFAGGRASSSDVAVDCRLLLLLTLSGTGIPMRSMAAFDMRTSTGFAAGAGGSWTL